MLTARVFTSDDVYPKCATSIRGNTESSTVRVQVDRHPFGSGLTDQTYIFEINGEGKFRVLTGEGQHGELVEVFYSSDYATA